ncbi:MAG: hypothetical protein H7A37_06180 [Chlamydiales bacterium]|nr:hypothetical protein [Chlamydiia bacterium]MCP5507870.1 hypothetical protein [Chlamydiales bacterium]
MNFMPVIIATVITFSQIADHPPHTEETVKIRGFIYETPEGEHYLADKPNLRSCCMGKEGIMIPISGDLRASEDSVVMIEGHLIDRADRKEIINAKIIEDIGSSWNQGLLAIPFFAVPAFYLWKRAKS